MQIGDDYPLEQYVGDFVNGRLISADWGTWSENVSSWIFTRGSSPTFLLLRYEDLMSDTERELFRIANFLGVEAGPTRLQQAMERSSADRMRKLEKQEEDKWVATKTRRKDIPFVRVAKSGGWRSSLPEPCVRQIESAWGELMTRLNYELVTVPVGQAVR